MSINKFGILFRSNEPREPLASVSYSSLKDFVNNNALCMNDKSYDARGRKIRRVSSPVENDNVVNKLYVDTCISEKALSLFDGKRYDAKNCLISNVCEPVNQLDAATKRYVDNLLENRTLTVGKDNDNQIVNAKSRVIRNVGAPFASTDDTTKLYVDNSVDGKIAALKKDVKQEIQSISDRLTEQQRKMKESTTTPPPPPPPKHIDKILQFDGKQYNAKNYSISNLRNPVDKLDATPKIYVDTLIDGKVSSLQKDVKREIQSISDRLTQQHQQTEESIKHLDKIMQDKQLEMEESVKESNRLIKQYQKIEESDKVKQDKQLKMEESIKTADRLLNRYTKLEESLKNLDKIMHDKLTEQQRSLNTSIDRIQRMEGQLQSTKSAKSTPEKKTERHSLPSHPYFKRL